VVLVLNAVLWADRVSIRKRLGCSPYFMVTGADPILPLDIKEATWLVRPPVGIISEEELIGNRARALAKHRIHVNQMRKRIHKQKLERLLRYEKDNEAVIKDYKFEPGDLVLVRNTVVESSLNRKMKPGYLGPMIVVKENKGGSYILAEVTGAVWHRKVTKFRVVPYFAREKIDIPEGILAVIDASEEDLVHIENLVDDMEGPPDRDYLLDDVRMNDSDSEDDD